MIRQHVVVVGYGMATSRLIEEIRRADPDGRRTALTVVGEEPGYAYNRILLSQVLTGRMTPEAIRLQDKAWVTSHDVDLMLGVAVTAIDRDTRTLSLTNGERVRYDVLVLATGSRAWVPPTEGLLTEAGVFADGVVPFRNLADCHVIRERARPGAEVTVLGGGVLGLEVARALLERTENVSVVHPMAWLMERQLDQRSATMLATTLEAMGIRFRIGRYAVRYVAGDGLRLDDGAFVPTDLVVVAAGTRPETAVAVLAGLTVEQGIVVDDRLCTNDPRIFAIGDCAQHAGALSGFVAPAWEQARVLGELLASEHPTSRYHGSRVVASLKVPGVELATLGDTHVDIDSMDHEVLCLTDPTGGRYAKLVLCGDAVVGAITLGMPTAGASIAQHYTNRTLAPTDRLSLLLGPDRRSGSDPFGEQTAAEQGIVCLCNTVTRESLIQAWHRGARSSHDLVAATRATTGCGGCGAAVQAMADRMAESMQAALP